MDIATLHNNPALYLSKVGRSFGALHAVKDVSFTVQSGERLAVLGSNGAGKTTLFNLITGDLALSNGQIEIDGKNVSRMHPHQRIRRGLRRTYQISLNFPSLSVLQSVYVAVRGVMEKRFACIRPKVNSQAMVEAEKLIDRVNLSALINTPVSELSHGEQRQLEIAKALAGNPSIILFDEPAAGLSPVERGALTKLVAGLPREITIILIEHDMDVALALAERVIVMHDGTVFAEGTPDEIVANHEVQSLYLGSGHA